ncbi:polysaccharide deacetylase family protein [Methylotuvimicrobium sp. KM2]|uniref:polysaccharide deacetylase family protein n=1 Tax=Methylotuvimicrobium sp. KM2 TaxID=3133976 RepID=UPI0031011D46
MIDPLSKKLLAGAGRNGPVSLMYHSITPGASRPAWQWALSFRRFEEQLALLQDFGWTTILADELATIDALPAKSVLLTFDDGYADNYAAFEALAKRGMKASWYVVTQDLGQTASWRDDDAPRLPLLTPAQLLEMQAAGMEIGSHTHSHCRLTQADPEQIEAELTRSRAILSDLLDRPVSSFAYPYGLYNESVMSTVQAAGYRVALTTRPGFGLVDHHLLAVRRVSIMADDTLSSFARKLAFADNDVSWSKLGRYVGDRIKDRLK